MARIKVCRVTNVQTVRALAALGVDYVGLHLISAASTEKLRALSELIEACATLRAPAAVLVAKHLSLEHLIGFCKTLKPPIIQLHDPWTADQVREIRDRCPDDTQFIVVIDPVSQSNLWVRNNPELADYILVDHLRGGTGIPLPANDLSATVREFRFLPIFIAGGLNQANVSTLIDEYDPFGVDVQTALEVVGAGGDKDIRKTIAFVNAVRGTQRNLVTLPREVSTLSLALTDFPASRISALDPKIIDSVDLIHLDHADGTVDTRFVRDSEGHAHQLHGAFPLKPYDCHLFLWNSDSGEELRSLLDRYKQENPFLRAAFFYVDPEDARSSTVPVYRWRSITHDQQVAFGLCLQARPLVPAVSKEAHRLLMECSPDYLSVAGPKQNRPIELYRSLVGPFCTFLREIATQASGIIIDRDVTVLRVKSIIDYGIRGAVGGRSIWDTDSPIDAIQEFRRALASGVD